ncbi:MAG: type I DNA topoisomerase [Lachnospiraceae bacterium]
MQRKSWQKCKIEDEVTDVVCEECGRNMVIKYGPHGRFFACPGFPECRNTKPYLEKIGVACPKCGKDIVLRKTKKGRKYYGCENNPECDFMSWQKPSRKMSEMRKHIWLRREISFFASMKHAVILKINFKE